MKEVRDDAALVLCGEAGQGIQTVEALLIRAFRATGYHIFSSKEYMSRVRGGENSTLIRVSSGPVRAFVDRIDVLFALSPGAVDRLRERINGTLIIADESFGEDDAVELPIIDEAEKLGGRIFANVVAAGAAARLFGVEESVFDDAVRSLFERKGPEIVNADLKAGRRGYELGEKLKDHLRVSVEPDPSVRKHVILNGTEAVGLGCIAGGCRFMSSYPMTPSSPLQIFIAENADEFDMVFEQAEDEIAAINMCLGASYAGARSLVATSGSGFALMEEAVGLAGMIETPIVIYIGQRPGPAVGLPTRTAQEDLNLALYSGPGEFARAIFAPGKLEDAPEIAAHAFNLADRYQIPVFILSDQYLADLYYNLPEPEIGMEAEYHIKETDAGYRRFRFTEDGISPRGIPGYGSGLVRVDSDEHDEDGFITEDLNIRRRMVEKRNRRLEMLRNDALPPEVWGDDSRALICWGSAYWPVREAIESCDAEVTMVHFSQVYPLAPDTRELLGSFDVTAVIENNYRGQFADLLKLEAGFEVDHRLNKYNGMPFSAEEVLKFIGEVFV
ncbi:2-oxoacid:acceptor oxidoreductase subunit alpha [Methanothermobacter marburgensis]|uniref:2-oxoacid:acceptor oxidoreductase subunit alpha n=1 Tax=Methanothermobacter marburgensis TaxID=145263 RepID=UPI0035B835CA